jgi:membrane-bound lytic murein transglycosylase A
MALPRRTLAGLAAALGLGIVLGSFGTWAWLRPPAPVAAETLTLSPASFASLPGWADDDLAAALPAFLASCARLKAAKPEASLAPAGTAAAGCAGDEPAAAISVSNH